MLGADPALERFLERQVAVARARLRERGPARRARARALADALPEVPSVAALARKLRTSARTCSGSSRARAPRSPRSRRAAPLARRGLPRDGPADRRGQLPGRLRGAERVPPRVQALDGRDGGFVPRALAGEAGMTPEWICIGVVAVFWGGYPLVARAASFGGPWVTRAGRVVAVVPDRLRALAGRRLRAAVARSARAARSRGTDAGPRADRVSARRERRSSRLRSRSRSPTSAMLIVTTVGALLFFQEAVTLQKLSASGSCSRASRCSSRLIPPRDFVYDGPRSNPRSEGGDA